MKDTTGNAIENRAPVFIQTLTSPGFVFADFCPYFYNVPVNIAFMDVHDQKTRSYNMSRIKGKNTKPEMLVRKFLFANGFRYRLNVKTLPGKPDIVLPKYKTVIFINGCFWHGHKGCKYFVVPKTRTEWWLTKIKDTQKRDREAEIQLNVMGWKVINIWTCELKANKESRLEKLEKELKNSCDLIK